MRHVPQSPNLFGRVVSFRPNGSLGREGKLALQLWIRRHTRLCSAPCNVGRYLCHVIGKAKIATVHRLRHAEEILHDAPCGVLKDGVAALPS